MDLTLTNRTNEWFKTLFAELLRLVHENIIIKKFQNEEINYNHVDVSDIIIYHILEIYKEINNNFFKI